MWGLKNLTNVSTVRLEKKHPRKSLQSCLYVPVNKWKLLWAEKSRSWTARAPLWCWKCPHGPVVKTNGSVGCGLLRYSLLVWRSCLCEQRKNKEHEDDKHSKSDPEADDDGVWNAREESHQSSLLWKLKPISHASPFVPVIFSQGSSPDSKVPLTQLWSIQYFQNVITAACLSVCLLMVVFCLIMRLVHYYCSERQGATRQVLQEMLLRVTLLAEAIKIMKWLKCAGGWGIIIGNN